MRAALWATVLVAGCAAAPLPSGLTLVPGETGLEIPETGLEIGFGRTQDSALASLARLGVVDPPLEDCVGGTQASLLDGLILTFRGQTFVGWEQGETSAGRPC